MNKIFWPLVLVGILAVIFVLWIPWLLKLPLNIVVKQGHAIAHIELLSEYPNDINLIELKDVASEKIIWRVVPKGELIQLHELDLVAGQNSSYINPYWGEAVIQAPVKSSNFLLEQNTLYSLRICPASWMRSCASEEFKFKGMQTQPNKMPQPTQKTRG